MADPLEDLLRKAPLNDRQRAGLWDAYETSKNPDDLAARLKSIQIADDIKAQLWDLKTSESAAPAAPDPSPEAAPQAQTWSDKLGLNEPTTSRMTGFLRGAGAGAVDLAQGAVSQITGQLNDKLAGDDRMVAEAAQGIGKAAPPPQGRVPAVDQPQTMSGTVGSALPVMAEMVGGGAPPARAAMNALPRAERAAANFEKVMGAAKDIVVDVEPTGKHALRVLELSESGASLPKPVRDFLNRVTSPKKEPLTYKQSRDFASTLSKLSVDERNTMKPIVKREVAQMAAELSKANANAAKAAGKGAEYKSAMREYAQAMQLRDAIDAAMKHSKKAALGAAGLGGAYYLFNKD